MMQKTMTETSSKEILAEGEAVYRLEAALLDAL